MARYLANSFSLNMIKGRGLFQSEPITLEAARRLLGDKEIINAIGHPETDAVVRETLGEFLPAGQRISLVLQPGDELIVAQYRGPRLPEGATELPLGAIIEFILVYIHAPVAWERSATGYSDYPLRKFSSAKEALDIMDLDVEIHCCTPPVLKDLGGAVIRAMFGSRQAEER